MKIKRNTRSFEADEDVQRMLEKAQKDGLTVGEICNLALRAYGGTLIEELRGHVYKINRLSGKLKAIKAKLPSEMHIEDMSVEDLKRQGFPITEYASYEDLRADMIRRGELDAKGRPILNPTSPAESLHVPALEAVETDSSRLKTSSSSLGKKLAEANFERKLTKYERRAALKKPKAKRKTGRIHRS